MLCLHNKYFFCNLILNKLLMKAILFCISLMTISCLRIQASVFTAVKSGKWHQEASWDLSQIPCSKDTVVIPEGIVLNVNNHIRVLNENDVSGKLVLFGELNLNKNVALILPDLQWFNIRENGRLTGNKGAKIIIKEQLFFIFKQSNERYAFDNKNQGIMKERLILRLNDTIYSDFSIRNTEDLAFIEVQHSYNGTSWVVLDRLKAFANDSNEYRVISIKKSARKDNADFIKLVAYSLSGKPILLSASHFTHNAKKIETRKKLRMFPKHLFIFSVASFGSRFSMFINSIIY